MRFLQKYRIILIIGVLLMLCGIAYAADQLYRFRHNDHDALIIGEITHMDETGAKVKVAKGIVSAKNLNENHPKKQLKLSEANIIMPFGYEGFYNEDGSCKSTLVWEIMCFCHLIRTEIISRLPGSL